MKIKILFLLNLIINIYCQEYGIKCPKECSFELYGKDKNLLALSLLRHIYSAHCPRAVYEEFEEYTREKHTTIQGLFKVRCFYCKNKFTQIDISKLTYELINHTIENHNKTGFENIKEYIFIKTRND